MPGFITEAPRTGSRFSSTLVGRQVRRRGCPATPARGRQGLSLQRCVPARPSPGHQSTRLVPRYWQAQWHPLPASRLPLAVRQRKGTGALALALTGLHVARASQAGGQMARTRSLPLPSGLAPLPTGLGSGSRAPTHRCRCCTRSAARAGAPSLSLSLTLTPGRPLRFVFLPLLVAPSLHSFFLLLPTFLTRPRQSTPFPRETALSVSRVRMNLPHSWSVSSSLPYPPRLNLLVPRGASFPRPRVDSSNLSS